MSVQYILSRNALSVFIQGRPHPVDQSNPNYDLILDGLRNRSLSEIQVLALVNQRAAVEAAVAGLKFGAVTVGQDGVFYGDKLVPSHLTTKMLEILARGLDITPWGRFLDRIYHNQRQASIDAIGNWLVFVGMPITTDGMLLAYKKVRADHSAFIGDPVAHAPDTTIESEDGLAFSSWDCLPRTTGNNGRVMIVEIDPADIVSIPLDYHASMGVARKFRVLAEIAPQLVGFAYPNFDSAAA